jgi:hypothetical protein
VDELQSCLHGTPKLHKLLLPQLAAATADLLLGGTHEHSTAGPFCGTDYQPSYNCTLHGEHMMLKASPRRWQRRRTRVNRTAVELRNVQAILAGSAITSPLYQLTVSIQ